MKMRALGAFRRKQNANENDDHVKVYVSNHGSLYVNGNELARSATWRAKVKELIDADLTGRNRQECDA